MSCLFRLSLISSKHFKYNAIIRCLNDSAKQEVDVSVRRIRFWKRLFALSLFGVTLGTALFVKQNRRKEWMQILEQTKRIQGQKFGDLELYEYRGFVLPEPIIKNWKNIENFKFRNEDVVLMSFPKTGITWLQEIVWLIANDLNYTIAKTLSITERFPYLEFVSPGIKTIEHLSSPRFIKTHLTPSLLNFFDDPQQNENRPKVLAIMRNPKDVLVSYYHFSRMNNLIGYKNNFDDFFDRFVKGFVPYGPIWKHYLDLIKLKEMDSESVFESNRVLIIFFEDLKIDFENQINRICDFLGKQRLNENEINLLKIHCSFSQMSLNPTVNYKYWDDLGFRNRNETEFMRKGEVGDWKNYFNNERDNTINQMITEKLGTKFNFIYE